MKKLIAILLAAAMLFAFAACSGGNGADVTTTAANADESTAAVDAATSDLAYIKEKGKMIVGMTIYKPMNYKDDNGELTGFDTDFAKLVGEKLGVTVEFFEIGDWDQKFTELSTKNIDCIWNGMTITEEALKNSSVSDAYVKNAQVIVMAADKLAEYPDTASMKDLKFVAETGSAGEKEIQNAGFANYTAVKYQADALLEVKSGTADACVIDITMANSMTGEGTSYADLGYSVELSTEEYGISFRTGSDVTAQVNAIMAELKADGTLKQLADKYEVTLA